MANTFTAVDLSRLPEPDVVEALDFESIFSAMLSDLQSRDTTFDALTEADPAYKILEVAAYRELLLRQRVNNAARAVMLAYAEDADLDQIGALFGVQRLVLDPGDPVNGIDPTMESNTEFRRRIQLAPEGFSVAGPEGAYIYHALGADPGVLDASATSPSPGDVVVSILARDGDGTAGAALLNSVAAVLQADNVRPMTDRVSVQSAQIISYVVEATLYTYAGPGAAVVLAEARAQLQTYIEDSHRLGRDVTLSGLYAALHVQGVQRVTLNQPTADIVVSRTQATHCTAATVTHGGVDE
ncbi:baseplate assembly protein [Microbulbifer sp. 2201CG32-9]|uniref:baseplate assembly protein n=1 Tax=Microbulbifer sp. 2201CG32-9 TaxID=3232309 RepID=UPI00345BD8F8